MGMDKSLLVFQGTPQIHRCYGLLSEVCGEVFLSLRRDQELVPELQSFPVIRDRYQDIGPISGILSAFEAEPDAAWLAMACDMPLVTRETIQQLVRERDPRQHATAFSENPAGFPEPLLAIYEPSIRHCLAERVQEGKTSLREAIHGYGFKPVRPSSPLCLSNVNSPEELARVKKILEGWG